MTCHDFLGLISTCDKHEWYLTATLSASMDERAYVKILNNIKGSNLNF